MLARSLKSIQSSTPSRSVNKRFYASSASSATYQTTRLSNGVKVVTAATQTQAASVGVYFDTGSRFESGSTVGVTGVLRRLAFKGTQTFSPLRMTREFETLPATFSVGVGREQIGYNSEVELDKVYPVLSLLGEVSKPSVTEYNVRLQRNEVEKDTAAVESDPKTFVFELSHREAYRSKGLGNSVYTPSHRLKKVSDVQVKEFLEKNYYSVPAVVVATGGVDHATIVQAAEDLFGKLKVSSEKRGEASKYEGGEHKIAADVDTHFALSFEGASLTSKDYPALSLLRAVLGSGDVAQYGLGSGQSSRLYKSTISSNLVSQVEAFNLNYSDSGLFGVFGVAQEGKEREAVEKVVGELKQLTSTAVSAEELNRAKQSYKAQVLFNNESRSALSDFLASQVSFGKSENVKSPEQFVESVESVSAADLQAVAKKVFKSNPTFVAVGEVSGLPTLQSISASL